MSKNHPKSSSFARVKCVLFSSQELKFAMDAVAGDVERTRKAMEDKMESVSTVSSEQAGTSLAYHRSL